LEVLTRFIDKNQLYFASYELLLNGRYVSLLIAVFKNISAVLLLKSGELKGSFIGSLGAAVKFLCGSLLD